MIEILKPAGDFCAGQPYLLEALGADGCLLVEWKVVGQPVGVSPDDVIFLSPNSLETQVILPTNGQYIFLLECQS